MKVPDDVLPGDVIAVHTGNSWGNRTIRAGEWLVSARRTFPNLPPWPRVNHVVMVTDLEPRMLGIEGRPSGVGYVDLSARDYAYLSVDRATKTPAERIGCVEWARGVAFGKAYDWDAIAEIGLDAVGVHDALQSLGIPDLWREDWNGQGIPGHMICSTAWVWIRDHYGIPRPLPTEGGRYLTPLDWDAFNRSSR